MPLEVFTIPCLRDNYAYLLHDAATGAVGVVDVPEAQPILEALAARGWTASTILITHHHDDHIAGVEEIRRQHGARVVGALADQHRLPALDEEVREGDTVTVGSETGQVIEVPGHTVGHIAFHFPDSRALFTADSLMALGCGRLFEGTGPQMWDSLSRLSALPPETLVYSGHEYTASNARFARAIDPENAALIYRCEQVEAARAEGRPTVPSLLSEEISTNPFLRAGTPEIRRVLDMPDATDAEVFTEIRRRKDAF